MRNDPILLPSLWQGQAGSGLPLPSGDNYRFASRDYSITVRLTPRVEDGQNKMDVEVCDETGLLIWLDDHIRECIAIGVEGILGLDEISETHFEAEAENV